jgi:hypothetical protein
MGMKKYFNIKVIAAVAGGVAAVGLVIGLAFALRGPSSGQAKQDFCDSLTNLSTTVMNYQGLNPATATNEELDSAYDDIKGAYDQVVQDADDWANAYDNPLAEAYDNLYWAAQDLPDDYTVSQDMSSLSDELAAFPGAFHETFDGSGCSTTSS